MLKTTVSSGTCETRTLEDRARVVKRLIDGVPRPTNLEHAVTRANAFVEAISRGADSRGADYTISVPTIE